MSDIRRLPVPSLTDVAVLPGMVVPIELDEPAQAAVDAAKSAHSSDSADSSKDGIGEVLLAPRLKDRYSAFGVVATTDQVGRLAGDAPAVAPASAPGSPVRGQHSGCRPNYSTTSRPPIAPRPLPPNTSRWSSPTCRSRTPGR